MKTATLFRRVLSALSILVLSAAAPIEAHAADRDMDDDDFFTAYQKRATQTQSKQPGWSVPLLAPHAGLIQSYRQDVTRQVSTTGVDTWNIGSGKGFNFIPLPNTQIDINTPSYHQRDNGSGNGFGDFSIGVKYRVFTANEKKGNYSAMLGVAASFPTGSHRNGVTDSRITPNFTIGKGWGNFDIQTSASIALPVGNTANLGRPVAWNTLAQYKVGKYFWPEIESNTTFFQGGANQRNVESFILPGVMSKFRLRPHKEGSRLTLASGTGMQFAVTHFHTYDHMPIVSVRFGF